MASLNPRKWFQRDAGLSFDAWLSMYANYMSYGGSGYSFIPQQTMSAGKEEIEPSFSGFVLGAYKGNTIVFACMAVRQLLFSEARFQFQRMEKGRPGDLYGTKDLALLETPWPNGSTGDMLSRAIQDADLAGNAFIVREPGRLRRLRPDWVTIVLGSQDQSSDPRAVYEADLVGYAYHPGGKAAGADPVIFLPEQVCHFAPYPDPIANYRGMTWLSPILREVMSDAAATQHKLQFFQNAATPNMVVKLDPQISKEMFDRWIETFRDQHEGVANAYKTLYLGGGADATVVGSNFEQMDFKVTQGAGETRIAAAAGVPPVIVGLSEGLASATYSNYQLAMRRFSDLTMRPLWHRMADSLASIITVPSGSRLWYDDRDIPALAEDERDHADIQQTNANTLHAHVAAGFEPDSAIKAVVAGDLTLLLHTGLYSVQLQPAGGVTEGKGAVVQGVVAPADQAPALPAAPSKNGSPA